MNKPSNVLGLQSVFFFFLVYITTNISRIKVSLKIFYEDQHFFPDGIFIDVPKCKK